MKASDLKYHYQERSNGYFFDRKTMRFFGDTMANYGVATHEEARIYELYRKRPVKHNLQTSHYFSMDTFEEVINPNI